MGRAAPMIDDDIIVSDDDIIIDEHGVLVHGEDMLRAIIADGKTRQLSIGKRSRYTDGSPECVSVEDVPVGPRTAAHMLRDPDDAAGHLFFLQEDLNEEQATGGFMVRQERHRDPASFLQTGFSDQELDELGDFLQSRALPKGGMEISMLDGYLTAIVSGPELIPPSEWFERVWSNGVEDDANHTFETEEEAQRLPVLVLRRMNNIVRDLEQDEIEPIFLFRAGDDGALPDLWCAGYLQGMSLRLGAWEPLINSVENFTFLLPIFALGGPLFGPDRDDEASDDFVDDEQRGDIAELIPGAAAEIYRYWLARRTVPAREVGRGLRIGRNEPCPCGSGKKYKKCCGQS
jgi:uncharacterized protein